jgi:L-lactate dehydrogenase complex protein LldG
MVQQKQSEAMTSRALILERLKQSSVPSDTYADEALPSFETKYLGDPVEKFKELIQLLHGEVIEPASVAEIRSFVDENYSGRRVILRTTLPELDNSQEWENEDPHMLENVEFALFEGRLGVAENGAVWFNEELMGERAAPYITQQMGIVLKRDTIVPTLVQAYEQLGEPDSGFGGFIAGPSKTADIEQSLVTGAHGARGLVVFLIG